MHRKREPDHSTCRPDALNGRLGSFNPFGMSMPRLVGNLERQKNGHIAPGLTLRND
jgi:hypothetical protein